MILRLVFVWAALLVLYADFCVADTGFKRRAVAVETFVAPVIDGELSDVAWKGAHWIDGFVQKTPKNGEIASRRTTFAVLYNDTHLFFGIRCEVKSKDEIVTRLVRRDRDANFDNVEITLSTRGDSRTGYSFLVNPSGVKRDRYWSTDMVSDAGWDAIWDAETHIEEYAWTVEIAIPLEQLRIPIQRKSYQLQVSRWLSRLREVDVFNPVSKDKGGNISTAGVLVGVEQIEGHPPLSITPETYLSVVDTTSGFDSRRKDGLFFGGGGYAKVGLMPDLVLDVAVLPDFGQVEVDDVVLNLSTYETQFPEKRPFFLEGAGLFNTPIQLFYSRRLGQPPPDPDLEDDEEVAQGASITPILGAVKLTGRSDRGLSLGVIEAMYLPTEFIVEDDKTHNRRIKKGTSWTNALAIRAINEVGKSGSIGFLGTALNPNDTDGAYTGGLDWYAATTDRVYVFNGQIAGSVRFEDVYEKEEANGAAVYAQIGKLGGQPLHYQGNYRFVSKGFDPNDLGYEQRDSIHKYVGSFDYSDLDGFGPFKQAYFGAGFDGNWNLDGVRLYHSIWFWQSVYWKSNWSVDYSVYGAPPHFDDRETRGDHPLWLPGAVGARISTTSPPEKTIGIHIGFEGANTFLGYALTSWSSLYFRFDRIDFELSPKVKRTHRGFGYVDTLNEDQENEMAVVGRRNITELNLTLKGTVVFTRDLTFQVQGQLLNVSMDYSDYSRVLKNGRLRLFEYVNENGVDIEEDYARTDLVFQVVLRWEYLPGSTIFVIYTHKGFVKLSKSGARVSDTLNDLPDEEREQLLMLKLSHHFGL